MKPASLLAVLFSFFFWGSINAQKDIEVPSAVQTKFKTMYPEVKKVKWEMEDGRYEASFEVNKKETSVVFSPNGMPDLTETEIDADALPKAVTDYIHKNMPGKKISEAMRVMASNGTVTYEVNVDKTDYLFDAAGHYTGMEKEESGEDEDD